MKKIVGILCFAFLAVFVFSQEISQEFSEELEQGQEVDQNLVVSKIQFIGLKKTQDSYIQSRVKKFVGKPLAETDMHGLETAIQLEGLFDDIQISTAQTSDTEAEISVSVKEKITFIPLPFAMYSSSGFMAGAVVMDTNAFGRKDMFMLGGMVSNTTKMAMASFAKNGEVWGFSTFGSFSKNTPELQNLDEDTVLEYNSLSGGISASISYKCNEIQSFSLGFGFKAISADSEGDYPDLVESIVSGSASLSYNASVSDWNGLFMSTKSFRVSAGLEITNSDEKKYRFAQDYSARLSVQQPVLFQRLRFYMTVSDFFGFDKHISSFQGQSAASVTILPGKFSTERLFGGNAGLEFAVIKGKYGLVSLYSDYQVVWAEDCGADDFDFTFMHGPNGGIRVYLAKIAFPALAMGVSYNVTKSYWQYSAAMGVNF